VTRKTNERIAGFTFLAYIAAGVSDMALTRASGTQGAAATLAHTVLSLLTCFAALVLAVTLYAITRDQDRDLALLALTCRVGEGVLGAIPGNMLIGATFFAVGSSLFSWLLLRGRMIPVALAWLGIIASVLLVAGLPLEIGGLLRGPITQLIWLPMAAFEIPLGLWLLIKGVAQPSPA
jgi:uncharacterized protein DUF4386